MKLCNFEVGLDKPFFLIAGPLVFGLREGCFGPQIGQSVISWTQQEDT